MQNVPNNILSIVEQRTLSYNVSLFYLAVKRLFDFALSFLGILILLPFLMFIAFAIKADSCGSVFFVQQRSGYKGKIFNMYKFRSMVSDAELLLKGLEGKNDVGGHMFKVKHDPRVTRVGRFIRKTSIDELPQLFNVLKGDMSLVGPRPPIVRELQHYDSWHNLRLSVKPGITGLWQISGRNKLGFDEMVRLDLKYIRERGFRYDIKILLRTIPVLFGDRNAY